MKKQGYICISFDDGYKSDQTVALQEQLNRGMSPKGTSYLIGAHVHETSDTKLSISEIQTMASYGWDFEDHSYHHYLSGGVYPNGMADLTVEQLNEELDMMDELFSNTLKLCKPDFWCVPGGTLTKKMMEVIGTRRKTINVGGARIITPYTNRFTFPSYDMTVHSDKIERIIDDVVSFGLAVNFYADGLNDSTAIGIYTHLLDYGLNSGVQFVNMRELYDILQLKGIPEIGYGY